MSYERRCAMPQLVPTYGAQEAALQVSSKSSSYGYSFSYHLRENT